MRKEEFYFDSRDNISRIHAVRYLPDTENVIGIVQIVHGMAEYVERYEDVAKFLTERNFVVVGEDHLGHGKTVGEHGKQGYCCAQDPATVLVRDSHRLKKMTQELYPGIPYFIIGHSMGSFMLRDYMARYGTGIDGAVLLGTGMLPGAVTAFGKMLAAIIKLFYGAKHPSKLLHTIVFGEYNKKIENPKTPMDWLTSDEEIVEKYMADPDLGFVFTVNGFATLFELISRAGKPECFERIPKQLPIYIMAGEKDPVGDYGKAVQKVYDAAKAAGLEDVSMKLYPESRHEILNDCEKEQVLTDIYGWISMKISEKNAE